MYLSLMQRQREQSGCCLLLMLIKVHAALHVDCSPAGQPDSADEIYPRPAIVRRKADQGRVRVALLRCARPIEDLATYSTEEHSCSAEVQSRQSKAQTNLHLTVHKKSRSLHKNMLVLPGPCSKLKRPKASALWALWAGA